MAAGSGIQVVITSQGIATKKRKFKALEDITNKPMKNVRIRYRESSEGPSQEVKLNEHIPYVKPYKSPFDGLKIYSTEASTPSWANPTKLLSRGDERKQGGRKENALRDIFMRTIDKRPSEEIGAKEFRRLKRWVRRGGDSGREIIPMRPATTKKVKGRNVTVGPTPPIHVVIHNGYVSYNTLGCKEHKVLCTHPGCLSTNQSTQESGGKCCQHFGPTRYGVAQVSHQDQDVINVYCCTFKYSCEDGARQQRKDLRFTQALRRNINSASEDNSWKRYSSKFSSKIKHDVMHKFDYGTPEQAERKLALLETCLLFAKCKKGTIKGKQFNILHPMINLAYKDEEKMVKFLKKKYKIDFTCQEAEEIPLSDVLGRRAQQGEKPSEGERMIYWQVDHNIGYSGEMPSEIANGIATKKPSHTPLRQYELDQGEAYNVKDYPFVITKVEHLHDSEMIINLGNYIGHLWKLNNPFSQEDYICLNKQVKTEVIINSWDLVQNMVQHTFKKLVDFKHV